MRKTLCAVAVLAVVSSSFPISFAVAQKPPAPQTPGGKCAKAVGGHYDWERKMWFSGPAKDAAWRKCVASGRFG
jgi:hypothetical protein